MMNEVNVICWTPNKRVHFRISLILFYGGDEMLRVDNILFFLERKNDRIVLK